MKRELSQYRGLLKLIMVAALVFMPGTLAVADPDSANAATGGTATTSHLSPLLASGKPVDWWFVFKFNAATFPGDESKEPNPGIFGGQPTNYRTGFSLSYAYASSANPSLQMGAGCIGTSLNDPLGATFDEIFHGNCYYVLWNDQFYNDPMPKMNSPWGHSKGAIAWDDSGAGFVMQVTTPSWPASGSANHPRKTDGNTLGCIGQEDDVMVSQHFFALRLSAEDVATVLEGLANASVVTKPGNLQIFNDGGPANLHTLAEKLGIKSKSSTVIKQVLSTGVTFISKPSAENVPPWQLVSAELGGVPLRAATWWANPDAIDSTTATSSIGCWDNTLGQPNAVQIAISGTWQGNSIGLKGGDGKQFNHAKIGVSMDPQKELCIFGDMNQQGTLSGNKCDRAQNGRGGTFYVLQNHALFESMTALLNGASDPVP